VSVLDASALVRLLLRLPGADVVEGAVFAASGGAHAPDLADVEVMNVLRKGEARQELSAARAAEACADLRDLPLARYPPGPLLERVWWLRHNFSPYDALYVALAEALDDELVTGDGRLARAAREHAGIATRLVGGGA